MAKPALKVHDDLTRRALAISRHITRVSAAHSSGQLNSSDLDQAYSGAYLAWFTALENSIEDLFLGLLVGTYRSRGFSGSRIVVRSRATAASVIRNKKKGYIDWFPYQESTQRLAEVYLVGGRPFTSVSREDEGLFRRMLLIRNAVAHDSDHALKQFRSSLVDGLGLPSWQHKPGGYLRGIQSGSQTRFDSLMAEGLKAIEGLCH